MKMTKAQARKFEELMGKLAKANETTVENIKTENHIGTLYSYEEHVYEAQAVLNFFAARVKPLLEKGENPVKFDARYREWRIRECKQCTEKFAYAFAYDGVSYCSLDCLDAALKEIGLEVTRGRDLKKRWGIHYHPAIVNSSALATLERAYGHCCGDAFSLSQSSLPTPHLHHSQSHAEDIAG